ncbi:cytochrome c [Chitinophaga agrisoli]|uniref:Cytochrome c n=1 Tax=Chitinophaga agrisoli TaxID=2607653 RepID=A0A5B2W4N8_9BACT|nr:cytochrome c [Chitinophaga agrisoli]KAA2245670.1 cytochrome c [Chitinophaga agrisoli]
MRKFFKWVGIIAVTLVALLLIGYAVVWISTDSRINKQYSVQVKHMDLQADSAMVAYGARLFNTQGCAECHGAQGEGRVFINDPKVAVIGGSNITTGKGGLPAGFDDNAWLMALRHGLTPKGKPLMIMPSYDYAKLATYELASIVAYCKTLPAVDHEVPAPQVGPLGRVLTFFHKLPLVPAEETDHQYQPPAIVKKEVSPAYGKYLSITCTGCHQPDFKGGPNHQPGRPQVANITSKGHLGQWTTDQFITTLRTGKTPEGKQLNNEDMPWKMTAQYTDDELKALYLYLRSL